MFDWVALKQSCENVYGNDLKALSNSAKLALDASVGSSVLRSCPPGRNCEDAAEMFRRTPEQRELVANEVALSRVGRICFRKQKPNSD